MPTTSLARLIVSIPVGAQRRIDVEILPGGDVEVACLDGADSRAGSPPTREGWTASSPPRGRSPQRRRAGSYIRSTDPARTLPNPLRPRWKRAKVYRDRRAILSVFRGVHEPWNGCCRHRSDQEDFREDPSAYFGFHDFEDGYSSSSWASPGSDIWPGRLRERA